MVKFKLGEYFTNRMKIIIFSLVLFSKFFPNYPLFEIKVNNNPYPSKIFVSTETMDSDIQNHSFMTILDENLDTYWQVNSYYNGRDFKKNNDRISYHKFVKHGLMTDDDNTWENNHYFIFLGNDMVEIDTLKYDFGNEGFLDWHDVLVTENNGYLFYGNETHFLDLSSIGGTSNNETGKVPRIIEFDEDKNIIFNWSALDHLNIFNYSELNFGNSGRFNWTHFNSVDFDFDGNILASNRRGNEIIKINKQTGDVMWTFSGPRNQFNIIGDNFGGVSDQHDARRLANGNILIFDNGNNHNPPTTRVVEYQIDEQNMTAELVWEFHNPYDLHAIAKGSSQRLPNGNTLINWGTLQDSNGSSDYGASIMEVKPNSEVVLEIEYSNARVYKVRKDDWVFDIPMMKGDLNLDGIVDILDIINLVNYILSQNTSPNFPALNLFKTDLNYDQLINITDIIELVMVITN